MATAALSLLVAVAAVVAAWVAWPTLRTRLQRPEVARRPPSSPESPKPASGPREHPAVRGDDPRVIETRRNAPDVPRQTPPVVAEPVERRPEPPQRVAVGDVALEESRKPMPQADAAVTHELEAAMAALRRHDLPAAATLLDAAAEAAGDDIDLTGRVDRWRLLRDYVEQLDGHVAKALAAANAGREYVVGDRTISVIEARPESFAYRESGKTKRLSQVPRVVERAILSAWFDGAPQPANDILLGVHRLLDDRVDLGKVRTDWQAAAQGEPAALSIMPLLDDPALAGAIR